MASDRIVPGLLALGFLLSKSRITGEPATDSNWQQCIHDADRSDSQMERCFIQLVPDGPWWIPTDRQMAAALFGMNLSPINTTDWSGPFEFESAEEAYTTFLLLGGNPPVKGPPKPITE